MSTRLQRQKRQALAHPLWMRWVAFCALWLVTVASTVEAVHTHGELLPHHAAELHQPMDASQTAGGEEHCPLCVAMHSALPVSRAVSHAVSVLVVTARVESAVAGHDTPWHYAAFSRPPPTLL